MSWRGEPRPPAIAGLRSFRSGPIEFTTLEILFMVVVAIVLSAIVVAYMVWVRTKKFR